MRLLHGESASEFFDSYAGTYVRLSVRACVYIGTDIDVYIYACPDACIFIYVHYIHTYTYRQTDRQTDKQTDRQPASQADRRFVHVRTCLDMCMH